MVDVEAADISAECTTARVLGGMSLVAFMLQNVFQTISVRYVRTRQMDMFFSTTAVCLAELIKFVAALFLILLQERCNIFAWFNQIKDNIIKQPLDCLKIAGLAFLFLIQNNLHYVAASNLEAVTFQVSYQLKILLTALLSVLILGTKITRLQWLSLVLLFFGVALVNLQTVDRHKKKAVSADGDGQQPLLGLMAVFVSCLLSSFASVYIEKLLKHTPQSVMVRNVQLGFFGFVFGLITVAITNGSDVREKGFFFGYDLWVWVVVLLIVFGGFVVAFVIKYTDNIIKGFATSGAIVVACIIVTIWFDFQTTVEFCVGTAFVLISVLMYSIFSPDK